MEIVMPRAFASRALSIWSNADASLRFGYLSCRTLVIAAVSVVFPWSMCPMVPMLTCGLVRSNLALATGFLSSGLRGWCVLWGGGCWGDGGAPVKQWPRRRRYSPVALAMISLATLAGTSAYESNTMV